MWKHYANVCLRVCGVRVSMRATPAYVVGDIMTVCVCVHLTRDMDVDDDMASCVSRAPARACLHIAAHVQARASHNTRTHLVIIIYSMWSTCMFVRVCVLNASGRTHTQKRPTRLRTISKNVKHSRVRPWGQQHFTQAVRKRFLDIVKQKARVRTRFCRNIYAYAHICMLSVVIVFVLLLTRRAASNFGRTRVRNKAARNAA